MVLMALNRKPFTVSAQMLFFFFALHWFKLCWPTMNNVIFARLCLDCVVCTVKIHIVSTDEKFCTKQLLTSMAIWSGIDEKQNEPISMSPMIKHYTFIHMCPPKPKLNACIHKQVYICICNYFGIRFYYYYYYYCLGFTPHIHSHSLIRQQFNFSSEKLSNGRW